MRALGPEEEWARQMIHHSLGVPVEQHDDGSRPRMHDLDILYTDRPPAAVEVTAAADPASIELWNLMNSGDRWQVDGLVGGWLVTLDPVARANRLRRELPALLKQLEGLGISELRPRRHDGTLEDAAWGLGIRSAFQSDTDYPGSIYITLELPRERSGGWVADTGDALAPWIGEFLEDPEHSDVLEKLARSGATERHAFLYLPGFTTAPFSVSDLLMRDGAPLPGVRPQLPTEVTHAWVVSTWTTGDGFRWSPDGGWMRFAKTNP